MNQRRSVHENLHGLDYLRIRFPFFLVSENLRFPQDSRSSSFSLDLVLTKNVRFASLLDTPRAAQNRWKKGC